MKYEELQLVGGTVAVSGATLAATPTAYGLIDEYDLFVSSPFRRWKGVLRGRYACRPRG